MTEVALRQEATVSLIQDTAQDLSAAMTISKALVQTAFAPVHFKGKPEEGAAAILYGSTIGMDPLTSLQNIYVIGGRPALYARAMMAVVLSHGHQIWTESEGEGTVTVCGQRKGSARVEKITWTIAMAKTAGYTKNAKYQTDSRSMLYARAVGDAARRIAPDALLGMAYTVEELELEATEEAAPSRSSVSRLRTAVPAAPEALPEPAPDAAVQLLTAAQLKKLHTLFSRFNITRDQGLAYMAEIIGHDLETSKDLTKDEAVKVIDQLEQFEQPAVEEPAPSADDPDDTFFAELDAEAAGA